MGIPVAGDLGKHPLEPMSRDELLLKEDELIPICQKYFKELLGEEIPKEHIILDFVYPLLEAQLAKAKQHYEQKRLDRPDREKIADAVEVECWRCKYHENYPMNCYIEPITSPLCRHRYELAYEILALIEQERERIISEGVSVQVNQSGFLNVTQSSLPFALSLMTRGTLMFIPEQVLKKTEGGS